jgi:hypothetical protein
MKVWKKEFSVDWIHQEIHQEYENRSLIWNVIAVFHSWKKIRNETESKSQPFQVHAKYNCNWYSKQPNIFFAFTHKQEYNTLPFIFISNIFASRPAPLLPRRGGGVYPLVSVGAHLIIVFYCYVLIKSQCTCTIYIFTFSCNFSQLFYELCMFKAISNNSSVNHVRQLIMSVSFVGGETNCNGIFKISYFQVNISYPK